MGLQHVNWILRFRSISVLSSSLGKLRLRGLPGEPSNSRGYSVDVSRVWYRRTQGTCLGSEGTDVWKRKYSGKWTHPVTSTPFLPGKEKRWILLERLEVLVKLLVQKILSHSPVGPSCFVRTVSDVV